MRRSLLVSRLHFFGHILNSTILGYITLSISLVSIAQAQNSQPKEMGDGQLSADQTKKVDPLACQGQWGGHWSPSRGDQASSCECVVGESTWSLISREPLTTQSVKEQCIALCKETAVPTPKGKCGPLAAVLAKAISYPESKREAVSETLHGETISDPYRWLEDDRSEETGEWVKRQNKLTRQYLDTLTQRDTLRAKIEGVWNYAKMSTPTLVGDAETGRLFYTYNTGLENQAKLYTRSVSESHREARVILDPNTLSEDGTIALKLYKPSKRGHYLAYQFAKGGSDWVEVKVRDVRAGQDLKDHLKWIKFSGITWDKEGNGFYYSRYDAPDEGSKLTEVNEYQKLYYHKLGQDQSMDQLIYARADHKEWGFDSEVSEDGSLLIITIWQGASDKNQLFYKRLDQEGSPVIPLISEFNHSYRYLGNEGETLWLQTDRDAPRGQVIKMQLNQADPSGYTTVVPEQAEALTDSQLISDRLVLHYLKDASSQVRFFNLYGSSQGQLPPLGVGSIGALSGGRDSNVSYFSFRSFSQPTMIYRFHHFTRSLKVVFRPKLDIDTSVFKTEQVFVTSKDGAKIPAFIISSTQAKVTGPRPTVLYGYGGFNISLTPYFKPDLLPWLQQGGVYVVANLRGGGEYGEEWHKAGMRDQKQNVFDDFIAVAEWLIESKRTRADLLGIYGGSNGGLLVGACAQQRPDLYAAAMPAVGVMDMLRFHKFTIGWAWIPEYGDPSSAKDFPFLRAYSPLHNMKEVRAPATLVLTADHDDRVVPAHSFKYIATLQETHRGGGPTLIRIDRQAGHGAGTPTAKRIDAAADRWAFFAHHLKLAKEVMTPSGLEH